MSLRSSRDFQGFFAIDIFSLEVEAVLTLTVVFILKKNSDLMPNDTQILRLFFQENNLATLFNFDEIQ